MPSRPNDAMLTELTPGGQNRLVAAMLTIEALMGASTGSTVPDEPVVLRSHQPGDIGWVIQRHGEIYEELRGWDETFEALVADIGARFLRDFDPAWERAWIAERDGERIGSVFLTRRSKTVGQLRMLLVEPSARGQGLGRRLVGECVSHARYVGYRKMVLFTSKGLDSARRLYASEGFELVKEEPQHVWGQDHIEQWWELKL